MGKREMPMIDLGHFFPNLRHYPTNIIMQPTMCEANTTPVSPEHDSNQVPPPADANGKLPGAEVDSPAANDKLIVGSRPLKKRPIRQDLSRSLRRSTRKGASQNPNDAVSMPLIADEVTEMNNNNETEATMEANDECDRWEGYDYTSPLKMHALEIEMNESAVLEGTVLSPPMPLSLQVNAGKSRKNTAKEDCGRKKEPQGRSPRRCDDISSTRETIEGSTDAESHGNSRKNRSSTRSGRETPSTEDGTNSKKRKACAEVTFEHAANRRPPAYRCSETDSEIAELSNQVLQHWEEHRIELDSSSPGEQRHCFSKSDGEKRDSDHVCHLHATPSKISDSTRKDDTEDLEAGPMKRDTGSRSKTQEPPPTQRHGLSTSDNEKRDSDSTFRLCTSAVSLSRRQVKARETSPDPRPPLPSTEKIQQEEDARSQDADANDEDEQGSIPSGGHQSDQMHCDSSKRSSVQSLFLQDMPSRIERPELFSPILVEQPEDHSTNTLGYIGNEHVLYPPPPMPYPPAPFGEWGAPPFLHRHPGARHPDSVCNTVQHAGLTHHIFHRPAGYVAQQWHSPLQNPTSQVPRHGGYAQLYSPIRIPARQPYQHTRTPTPANKKQHRRPRPLQSGRTMTVDEWETMFLSLQAFHKHFGHCIVPADYEEDPHLVKWVNDLREWRRRSLQLFFARKGKITFEEAASSYGLHEDRLAKLHDIGFPWYSYIGTGKK